MLSAIRFLQSPQVLRIPLIDRVRYLEGRELSSCEIAEAFARVLPNQPETSIFISAASVGSLCSAALSNPSAYTNTSPGISTPYSSLPTVGLPDSHG